MTIPKPIRAIRGALLLLYMAITACAACVILIPLFCVIRPFSETFFVRFVCWLQSSFIMQIVFFLEVVVGMKIRVTGELPAHEGALVISNHLTHDWVCMYGVAYRMGTLGFVRTVIKKIVSYVPGFGWAMRMCYWPFVSRDFNRDEKVLRKLFTLYKASESPVQVWIFPEGTRFSARKLQASQAYAASKGYPVWKHVMLPKHRGFSLAVASLEGCIAAVHEVTLSYAGWRRPSPGLWDIVTTDGGARDYVMHVNLRRVPISVVPRDEEGQKAFLMDCFARKEVLLEYFSKNKCFPGTAVVEVESSKAGPLVMPVVCWAVLTCLAFILARVVVGLV